MALLGQMRYMLDLEDQIGSDDDFDPDDERWHVVCRIRAKVEPLTGNELAASQQVIANVTHRISTRYNPRIQPDMRLKNYNGTIYEIRSVVNVGEMNREMEMLAIQSTVPREAE